MKYSSLFTVGAMGIVMALSGCSNTASDVQSKLSYSNFPAVSGTTWSGTGIPWELTKVVTTITSTAGGGSVVATNVPLEDETDSLVFNSNGTFTLTETSSYDNNYDTNFIDDNLNYSTSNTAYSLVARPTSVGSSYTYYVQDGDIYSSESEDWIGHSTFNGFNSTLMAYYLSNNDLTPTFGAATTYNSATVYPLILPAACTYSGYAGKTYDTYVISGTYTTYNSSNSLDTTAYPIGKVTQVTETSVAYSGNSSPTTATTTTTENTIPSYLSQIIPTITKATNASGKTIYEMAVTAAVTESMEDDAVTPLTKLIKRAALKASSKGSSAKSMMPTTSINLLDSVPYLIYTP
jgi:hypothetical protein